MIEVQVGPLVPWMLSCQGRPHGCLVSGAVVPTRVSGVVAGCMCRPQLPSSRAAAQAWQGCGTGRHYVTSVTEGKDQSAQELYLSVYFSFAFNFVSKLVKHIKMLTACAPPQGMRCSIKVTFH